MTSWKTETFRVTELAEMITQKQILIPQYQRGQIWSPDQKASLIDSIKHGYPFGTILLYKQADHYVLIDGLQRSSTIHEFVNNPSKFFDKHDINNNDLKEIIKKAELNAENPQIVEKFQTKIEDWVKALGNMEDVVAMQFFECANALTSHFPTLKGDAQNVNDVANLLKPSLQSYISNCRNLVDAKIPAIVYTGDDSNLPLIFERINSQGTKLNKYQIFAATWSANKYKIVNQSLYKIIDYVKEHFDELISNSFNIDDYNPNILTQEKSINLYQLLYGFGKMISEKYPTMFKSSSGTDIESIGFNLVNACLLNDNNKMKNLPSQLRTYFENDADINKLLDKIIDSISVVSNLLKPITEFKLNGRSDFNSKRYHTEMQICSMIATVFLGRYANFTIDEDQNVHNLKFDLARTSTYWEVNKKHFKQNAIITYVHDVLVNKWSGTGDKKLDEIIKNRNYYLSKIEDTTLTAVLGNWIEQSNDKNELKKVSEPSIIDKMLLSIIYKSKFSAEQQLDKSYYDIEHLIPKDLLKSMLLDCKATEGLPISSFANLCLLPEYVNRKKKQKTLYQDTDYLSKINQKTTINLEKLEIVYTFTNKDDMSWVEIKNLTYENLSKHYRTFLSTRKNRLIKEIINGLRS
jgi:hypothetical protein